MKVKFEPLFRAWMVFLVIMLAWGLWAGAQTGTNAPATNQIRGPTQALERLDRDYLTFGLDGISTLREHKLLGEPLWKYLASAAYIFLAFLVSRLIDMVAGGWLRKLTARTKSELDDLLLELLRGPIKVVALVILLHIGLNIFDWSPAAKGYSEKLLILIVAASLTYLCVKLISLVLEYWRQRIRHADTRFDDQLFSVVGKSLKAFVIIVAIMVTAQNVGINITAAITSLSIGGLAVGLAAQDTLANLFGAVAVFADKPFRVGDHVRVDNTEGSVESVGLRSTRLRNGDGQLVTIPNKAVANAIITNISHRPNIKTVMNLALVHHLPADKVRRALAILGEAYRGHPMTQDVWISFNHFAGRNINVTVLHWWKGTNQQQYLAGMQELNLAVKEKFDAEDIRLGR